MSVNMAFGSQRRGADEAVKQRDLTAATEFAPGDTFTLSSVAASGYITGSTRRIFLGFALPKLTTNITSIDVDAMSGTMRGASGYVDNNSSTVNMVTTYTVTVYSFSQNQVVVEVNKSSAYANITNNTLVNYLGTLTLSFS